MAFRAVLFDLGQTLLEYPGNTHEFWRRYLEEQLGGMRGLLNDMGAQVEDTADAFAERAMRIVWPERRINMSGRSWHFCERMRALLGAYGRQQCTDEECGALTDAFYKPIAEATRRYPEALKVLEALTDQGIRMAIISNAPWDVPGRLLRADMRRWDIEEFFDAFVMSGDMPWRKPNPEFMWTAARYLGVTPDECLVVGDSLRADIEGAKAAGMRSVWINREGRCPSAGQPQPDWTFAGLKEVARILTGRGGSSPSGRSNEASG
jgi:HAD superfamily hydrolase (TIGR01662 family)